MFHRTLLVILSLFIFSCSRHKPEGKVLPKETMVPLLVGIHLAEAKNNTGSPFEGGRSLRVIGAYDSLFTVYKVQPEDFYASFNYYKAHPAEMDSLYQDVINELTKRESDISKKPAADKNKKDSTAVKRPAGEP